MAPVNLIPGPKRLRQQSRRRRRWWVRFLRVYAIVLAVAGALSFIPAHAGAPSLESDIARIDRRIESRGKDLDALRRDSARLTRRLEIARAVGDHPDWSYLLAAIGRARGQLAVVESIDLSTPKEADKPAPEKPGDKNAKAARQIVLVKLAGYAASPAECVQFAGAIENLNVFERVTVKDTRAQPLGRMSATHFEIEAVIPIAATAPSPSSPTPGGAK